MAGDKVYVCPRTADEQVTRTGEPRPTPAVGGQRCGAYSTFLVLRVNDGRIRQYQASTTTACPTAAASRRRARTTAKSPTSSFRPAQLRRPLCRLPGRRGARRLRVGPDLRRTRSRAPPSRRRSSTATAAKSSTSRARAPNEWCRTCAVWPSIPWAVLSCTRRARHEWAVAHAARPGDRADKTGPPRLGPTRSVPTGAIWSSSPRLTTSCSATPTARWTSSSAASIDRRPKAGPCRLPLSRFGDGRERLAEEDRTLTA